MQNIKRLFIEFIGTYGLSEKDLTVEGGYSGTFSHYNFLKNLFSVYKYIIIEDNQTAAFQFKKSLAEIDFNIDMNSSTDEEIENSIKRRNIIKEVNLIYNELKEDIYNPLIKLVEEHNFFENETISEEEVPADILLNLKEWMGKNYLKKYSLKEGKAEIPKNLEKFQVSTDLYMSNNLNYFLDNFNKEYTDDIVRVSVFFKIEKEPEYSYFMFIMNYKDHVIVFSDVMFFDNPHMITASRSPGRKVAEKHEGGLPYKLIDDLKNIRENDKTVSVSGNTVEFHKLKWSSFSKYQRVFTLLVIQKLVNTLSEGTGQLLVSSEKHMNQLKLESKDFKSDSWEEGEYTNWSDESKKYVKELIDNKVDNITTTDLAVISYDLVTKSRLYDESMLAPLELHDKHIKWHAINKQKEDLQDQIGTRGYTFGASSNRRKEREADTKVLNNMLNAKLESILFKLTQAEDLYFMPIDDSYGTFSTDGIKTKVAFRFEQYEKEKDNYRFGGGLHIGAKYGWGMDDEEVAKCPIFPKYKGSSLFFVNIRTYEQLMYLLDCKREDLPLNFRCYKSYDMKPYSGNSILSNTHPFLSLYDPTSSEYPNGLSISINVSKRGYNSIVKKHKNRPKIKAININNKEIDISDNNYKAHTGVQC